MRNKCFWKATTGCSCNQSLSKSDPTYLCAASVSSFPAEVCKVFFKAEPLVSCSFGLKGRTVGEAVVKLVEGYGLQLRGIVQRREEERDTQGRVTGRQHLRQNRGGRAV